jgi:hypothetical protein
MTTQLPQTLNNIMTQTVDKPVYTGRIPIA